MIPIWIVAVVGIVVMCGGVAIVWLMSGGLDTLAKSVLKGAPAPAPTPVASANAAPTPIPVASAIPVGTPVPRAIPVDGPPVGIPVPVDTPVTEALAPIAVDFNPNASESKDVRGEVLKRIDLMPSLKPEEKDKLYAQVDRARGMGLLIQIPFASGRSTLGSAEIAKLSEATKAESVRKLVEDPTVVFVILGYADTKGNEQANVKVSQSRADSALEVLRDKCGFQNVMHAVAMGGSDFFDAKQASKNRLAEVWAVLP